MAGGMTYYSNFSVAAAISTGLVLLVAPVATSCWLSSSLSASPVTADDTKLRNEIIFDEGKRKDIYRDHLGKRTVGIGHLLVDGDPEYGMPVGTNISEARIQELFTQDLKVAINDARAIFGATVFGKLPQEAQRVIINMAFNLGRRGLSDFKRFIAAVKDRNWESAAREMENSTWYNQVRNRADRLVERIRNLG